MKRKILSLLLAALMICSLCPSVFADDKTIPVKLTADEPTLSVTLPTSIPMQLKADGTVVCPTDLKIINNSSGPVEVSAITVKETDWGLTDYNGGSRSLLSAVSIGSKKIGICFTARGGSAATTTSGTQNLSYTKARWVIAGGNSALPIDCAAIASASKDNETTTMGSVVFMIGWSSNEALTDDELALLNPYLTFSSPSSFTLKTNNRLKNWDGTLEYSTDTSTWETWDGTTELSSSGNVLYLRGTGNSVITGYNYDSKSWVLTGSDIACSGNIETLLDYATVQAGNHPTMANYCYMYMFYGCTSLISAPALPATTLATQCYYFMFGGCTSLTIAPALPATTLAEGCYGSMFSGCTSLTTAPALPATTLADKCYKSMFYGCTNLTTVPELPATTLAKECYKWMFSNCTSLTTAPALPATTLVNDCYNAMFEGCTGITTAPALPATTLADRCYCYIFRGCTALATVSALPATTLAYGCYSDMFSGCTSLKLSETQTGEYTQAYRVPTSGDGITATDALTDMFTNTGGTFKNTPTLNTTYYLHSSNSVVS